MRRGIIGMSGSNAYLSVLFSGAAAGGSLVQTLYSATQLTDPLLALRQAVQTKTRDIATTEKQPEIKRDIDAFKLAISKAKTPADLFKNPVFVKVLLTANGLADQVGFTALATKALLANAKDTKSLVNQLTDTRWKPVNKLFDFANTGLAAIGSAKVQATLIDGYAEVTWRNGLDDTTPGLSDALSFRTMAATVTSVDQILGDPTLRRVVTTALGVPQEIAFQPLATQEHAIAIRLDLKKLKDPKFVDSFSQRYLLAVRTANAQSASNGLVV
jgi:pantoate kinase